MDTITGNDERKEVFCKHFWLNNDRSMSVNCERCGHKWDWRHLVQMPKDEYRQLRLKLLLDNASYFRDRGDEGARRNCVIQLFELSDN